MTYTTIQIKPETRKKLSQLKESDRETYDVLLNKLLELIPGKDEEGDYSRSFRVGLLNAKIDLKHGKTISHEKAKKLLGL